MPLQWGQYREPKYGPAKEDANRQKQWSNNDKKRNDKENNHKEKQHRNWNTEQLWYKQRKKRKTEREQNPYFVDSEFEVKADLILPFTERLIKASLSSKQQKKEAG